MVSTNNLEKRPILAEIVQLHFRERRQASVDERFRVGEEHAPRYEVAKEILALQRRNRSAAVHESARYRITHRSLVPVLNGRIRVAEVFVIARERQHMELVIVI